MRDIQTIPGYKVYEYQLVISPHEELRNKIMHIRQEFYEKYKASAALYHRPHIMLASFVQYELMEERIVQRLKAVAMGMQPAKIELKNFGSFPSHTIYINITSKLPVQSLVKQIRSQTQRLMKFDNDNKPHFILEPHLTIARKLAPWQYEQGWLEYSHRNFTGRFIADGMLLLKRPLGEMKYQVVQRFAFENLLVNTTQQALLF